MSNQIFGTQRPATAAERPGLIKRRDRLQAMTGAVSAVTATLTTLPGVDQIERVKVRNAFVWAPRDARTVSDRKAPPHDERPPATRLMTPTGSGLRFYLIALFEAQTRSRHAVDADRGPRPIVADHNADRPGWTDLIVTTATDSTAGDWMTVAAEKRVRTLRSALTTLAGEELVRLPHAGESRGTLEGFQLLREGGCRRSGPNPPYRIPTDRTKYFTVPATLFTRGWIYVLSDIELAFVLILGYWQHKHPGEQFRIRTDDRLRRHGLGRDAYSNASRVLADLGLVDVQADPKLRRNSRAGGLGNRLFSLPHLFRLLPDGFGRDGDLAMLSYLRRVLR